MTSIKSKFAAVRRNVDDADDYDTLMQNDKTTYSSNDATRTTNTSLDVTLKSILKSMKYILVTLPPPFNKHRRENKLIFLMASTVLLLLLIRNLTLHSTKILHPFQSPKKSDFKLAFDESLGFFDDIPSHIWMQKKQRVKDQPKHNDEQLGLRSKYMNRNHPSAWYQHNWDAEFTCPHERKIGGVSDGSKWTCDPHRLKHEDGTNKDAQTNKKECLVYSFGRGSPNTRTFDFAFEIDLLHLLGGAESCEIHFFDHRLDSFGGKAPDGVILHAWGLEGVVDAPMSRRNFMTLKETVHHLGHEGKELELMRVDCEGCEWSTFREWLQSGITVRQIMVTLHGSPKNEDDIFETLEANNYVIFHREADVRYGGMWQQYGFIRLAKEFFDRK